MRRLTPFELSPPEWKIAFGLVLIAIGLYSGEQAFLIGGLIFALLAAYRLWQEPDLPK